MAGMTISTSKSQARVLNRKKVACSLQAEEIKYLGVLFTSEGRMGREIDGWIGAAVAVMQSLYRSVVVKTDLRQSKALDLPVNLPSYTHLWS